MLEEKLRELAQSNRYPFHMPGHKRMLDDTNPYAIDITEIEDFDNLHHAEGIIKDAEDAAAKMYGAKKAYYLVNGSTCGILAAISAFSGSYRRNMCTRRIRIMASRDRYW